MSEPTPEERACKAMCECRSEGRLGTAYHTKNCPFIQWPRVNKAIADQIREAMVMETKRIAELFCRDCERSDPVHQRNDGTWWHNDASCSAAMIWDKADDAP